MGNSVKSFPKERSRRQYSNLENEKAQFAEWLATPENLRRPATQRELAELLNVSLQTLTNWSHDYRILGDQTALINDRIVRAWPEVIEAALETALDSRNPKQIQAIKLLADWHEQTQVTETVHVEDLSSAEIKELAIRMYDDADEDAEVA